MGTAWNKHIQPFLDSWQWDHFGLIWEPFLKIYPKLDDIQRKNVEDALIESIFDSDVDIAIKALFIVEALYDSNLASRRLFDLVANRLRVYAHAIKVDDPGSYYYIIAFSRFGITEAIPVIQSFVEELEKYKNSGSVDAVPAEDGNKYHSNYKDLLWSCCLSLAHMIPEDVDKWLSVFWKEFPERKHLQGKYGTGDLNFRKK